MLYIIALKKVVYCLIYPLRTSKLSHHFDADILDAISIEACVAGRNNYSGTAPECVERQRSNGKAVIAGEEKQIAQWKAIVESVQA